MLRSERSVQAVLTGVGSGVVGAGVLVVGMGAVTAISMIPGFEYVGSLIFVLGPFPVIAVAVASSVVVAFLFGGSAGLRGTFYGAFWGGGH
ncbi:MAG: hypothetical protein GY822_06075 [Deltaproteobacteria bacterium]|nr:hypothetical protein [Deltaproteobacteria bacterium]